MVPVIHQIELHPYFAGGTARRSRRVRVSRPRRSPLGNGSDLLQNPVLAEIAERHGVTPRAGCAGVAPG